jgi:hypothetical protein
MTSAELAISNQLRLIELNKRGVQVAGIAEQWHASLLRAVAEAVLGPERLEELALAHETSVRAALDQAEKQIARQRLLAK